MRVLYERCAAIDVHKDQVTVAVRTPGEGPGGRQAQVRKFRAFYGVLTDMARWMVSLQVTHVAMEATGIYTMPVYHALIEQNRFEQVLVCNAAHVKKRARPENRRRRRRMASGIAGMRSAAR